jgi:transcriptional regulator with XRE-family HTH domain
MNKVLKGKIVERFGSQREFARFIGVHETFISRVVRMHHELDDDTRNQWAAVLDVDVKTLFPQGSKEKGNTELKEGSNVKA